MRRSRGYTLLILVIVLLSFGYVYEELRLSAIQNQALEKDAHISALESRISNLEQELESEVLGVYFSPKGGCEQQILFWISRANISIHILIYTFTLDSISEALLGAHSRGIEVRVLLETREIHKYAQSREVYHNMREAGIGVRNDTNSQLMHNKVMIVDNLIVLTGSFNWSKNAEERNNENLIIISGTDIAGEYEEEFERIWSEGV